MSTTRRSIIRLAAVAVASAVLPGSAAAEPPEFLEWSSQVSDFDKLNTADAPAFVVLGLSPTEIQRPSTPKALAISLGDLVTGTGATFMVPTFTGPKGVAIEVAPYWLFPHRELSVSRYRDDTVMRPLRTLSLSIGTTQTTRTASDATGAAIMHTDADVGLGFRTMLFQHGGLDACTRAANAEAIATAMLRLATASEKANLEKVRAQQGEGAYQEAFRTLMMAKLDTPEGGQVRAQVDTKYRTDSCVALVASTTGLSIDLAGAIDVHVIDAKLTRAATSLAGYALWSDVSYDAERYAGVTVARLAWHTDSMAAQKLIDAGVRGIYKGKDYAFSAEALLRHRFASPDGTTAYKLDLSGQYELTSGTWLTVSFGKDFAITARDAGAWFSLANLQWSIGKPQI